MGIFFPLFPLVSMSKFILLPRTRTFIIIYRDGRGNMKMVHMMDMNLYMGVARPWGDYDVNVHGFRVMFLYSCGTGTFKCLSAASS